jgi:hypothetical protein
MDPEVKQYLEHLRDTVDHLPGTVAALFQAQTAEMLRRFDAIDARLANHDGRFDAIHLEFREKFIFIDDRFRTFDLRIEQFEDRM